MAQLRLTPSLTIEYFDSGPLGAPSILFLHGLGASLESWALQMPAFQEAGFRVLAADARGFGGSTYPAGLLNAEVMAADHAALLERLEAAPAHIVGLSMGGTTALQLTIDYAKFVRSAVLANTFAALRPASPRGWFYFLLRFMLVHTLGVPAQARAVSTRVFPHPDQQPYREKLIQQVNRADPRAYRAVMRSLARFNLLPRLDQVGCPTLIVTGDQDTTVPPRLQRSLAERIPGARHEIIPGSGHAASIDNPEEFNRIVLGFVLDHTPELSGKVISGIEYGS
jgi:3-oxoadipate enol-lactonase